MTEFDVYHYRKDFPILETQVNKRPLIYLDNAATTQKPRQVIEVLSHYYEQMNSNIHRGVHHLSQISTMAYENSREHIRKFINAEHAYEVIFTRGTTESINLAASSFGKMYVGRGDEILLSEAEHHSNIVPWQILAEEKGAVIKVIPITDSGEIDLEAYQRLLNPRVKIAAFTHVSNALGSVFPIKKMIAMAHDAGIPVLIDGAQAISHIPVDVRDLDADFYCFSGHKMYGPMGIGVMYGKEKFLENMPPYQGGGEMISEVSFEKTTYNELPYKFEAGTPNVGDALALDAAITYMEEIGLQRLGQYEHQLLEYATSRLSEVEGLKFIGTAREKAGVISILPDNIHPYDMGTLLDKLGIATRTGNHCAQPLMARLGIQGTIRISLALYNTKEEIDTLINGIHRVKEILS